MDLFTEAVNEIEQGYEALGHELGWRFLSTPARTLSKNAGMMFAGLNPGGAHFEAPVPSVEEGNAYRVERWGSRGQLSGIQVQVRLMYEGIAENLDRPVTALMDETLATNFCPFRSASWDRLPRRTESVNFSKRLWARLFEHVAPSVIVCLTDTPFDHFEDALKQRGFRRTDALKEPVGWGNVTYSLSWYESKSRNILMVRLPHLSRYKVFGRPESLGATDRLTEAIAQAIRTP